MNTHLKFRFAVLSMFGIVATANLACNTGLAGLFANLLGPSSTSVRFVNNTEFDIEGRIIIDDEQNTTEELLEQLGTEISFSVAANGTNSISRDCDDLQAFLLDDANLQLIGGLGPDTRSDVLRDGSDFNCGDTIVLTFTATALGTNFNVNVTVE